VEHTAIATLVRTAFPKAEAHSVTPMPGGASSRQYYRVAVSNGASCVAMFVPDGPKPEEVDKTTAGARWPFLEVLDLLADRGVDVPKVFAEDTAQGWLLLEDLSDDTLANYLLKYPERKSALYARAVQDLAHAQHKLSALPQASVVARRAFDFDLLRWEIEHFREWGLVARGITLSSEDDARYTQIADALAKRTAGYPRGFVHRDYQSRNLMVRSGLDNEFSLCWIDFQDALLGPRAYDLVALLGDSYQEFDRPFIETRLDEYAAALQLGAQERAHLGEEFDYITVQRKLKDAGRFVFIDRVKNNPSFLKFVSPTIAKVGAALSRLSSDADMRDLHAILRRAFPAECS
jgi:N-acetylmuramate 1-kinase